MESVAELFQNIEHLRIDMKNFTEQNVMGWLIPAGEKGNMVNKLIEGMEYNRTRPRVGGGGLLSTVWLSRDKEALTKWNSLH